MRQLGPIAVARALYKIKLKHAC